MRARLKLTSDLQIDSLVGVLKEHKWWPHFEQAAAEAQAIVTEIRDSLEVTDVPLFESATKYVLSHTRSESRGTLSSEHGVWVVRLLNPNVHLLKFACELLVADLAEYALRNHKKLHFDGPVQIVERQSKETIIQGQVLAEASARREYARAHRGMELKIGVIGVLVLAVLLLATFPWSFRDFQSHPQTWLFSVFEKMIGSVAVTTMIALAQYRAFAASLRGSTIRWSIPGEPERLDIKAAS